MLKMGVIRESSSLYASPVVVVKKKDNTNCICVDYQKLTKLNDPEPMLTAEHLFQKLNGDKYFTRIDLSKARATGKFLYLRRIFRRPLL